MSNIFALTILRLKEIKLVYQQIFVQYNKHRYLIVNTVLKLFSQIFLKHLNTLNSVVFIPRLFTYFRGLRGRDRMVVEFTTTYAISAYHH